LDFLRKIRLDHSNNNFINEAKISNDKLYVSFITNFMNVYDANTMRLIINYKFFDGILLNINKNIFSIDYDKISYFNQDGKIIKKISTPLVNSDFTQFEIDFKFYFSKMFLFYSITREKLVSFNAN
jgi:hypothetical protein